MQCITRYAESGNHKHLCIQQLLCVASGSVGIVCPVAMPNVEKDRQLDDKHLHSSSAVSTVLHGIVLSCTFCPGATSGRDDQV